MADVSQLSSDELPIVLKTEMDNSESISPPSAVPENSETGSSSKTSSDQVEETVDISDKTEICVEANVKVNVLEDIIQLIELVTDCEAKDGTKPKTKYKDGFIFLENLQTQFENIQEEVCEKDKMIVALVVENSTLKGEANTAKEELNKKCQQFEELEKSYTKFQNEIESQKIAEKTVVSSLPFDVLKSKADKLKQRFKLLNSKIERQGTTNDLLSIKRNINLRACQDDVESSLSTVEQNISLLIKCQKKIEEQLEYTQSSLQKLNDICTAETGSGTIAVSESQSTMQQNNILLPSSLPSIQTNIPGKPSQCINSVLQTKPASVSGFNLGPINVPTQPHLKPFSVGPNQTNDQYHKYSQQTKPRADPIPRSLNSRNPPSYPFPTQQKQPVPFGNSKGHHNNPLIQQYPNLISQAQNKCKVCGMTFFTSDQLKLHDDLVHRYSTSGPTQVTLHPSSLPYITYSQMHPNPSPLQPIQKHYHKHLWTSSQPEPYAKQKRMSANLSLPNQNKQKRHCVDPFINYHYPSVSISNNIANSANPAIN